MERRAYAVWTVCVGLGLGLLANLFFYQKSLGLSLPLFTLAVTGAVIASARVMHVPLHPRKLWLLMPILFFAGMVAVRADPLMIVLNIVAIFALGALTLHYLPLPHAIDEDTVSEHVLSATQATIKIGVAPFGEAFRSLGWLREHRPFGRGRVLAVGRGLLFTLPLLLVFAVLLGSADTVFGDYLNRAWQLLRIDNLMTLVDQGVVVAIFAWLGCGALAYGAGRHVLAPVEAPAQAAAPDEDESLDSMLGSLGGNGMTPEPAFAGGVGLKQAVASNTAAKPVARPKKHSFTLSMIEATMMLAGVDLLFGAFVVIQFAYFFGGQANVSVDGFTYAQYARRGFFELIAVSVLTLGLVLWLDWVTVRQTKAQTMAFRILAVVMVGLTGVMLWSASERMVLYEQAFGYTHLRLYTHVFMFWLAVLFGFFILALYRVRERIFSLGVLLVVIGYLVSLNVMNVEGTIAQQNVNRYLNDPSSTLDLCYLGTMSTDAVPAMLALYNAPQTDTTSLSYVTYWLGREKQRIRQQMESDPVSRFLSLNGSRAAAWAQLATAPLPEDAGYVPCPIYMGQDMRYESWD